MAKQDKAKELNTIVKELTDRGRKQGLLSYQEIVNCLEELDLDTDQIDEVYQKISEMGIDIIGDKEEALMEKDKDKDEEEIDISKEDLSAPKGISVDDPVRM